MLKSSLPEPDEYLKAAGDVQLIQASLRPSLLFFSSNVSDSPVRLTPLSAQRYMSLESGRIIILLLPEITYSIVKGFQSSFQILTIIILAGAIVSICSLVILSIHIVKSLQLGAIPGRSGVMMTMAGHIPYLYGLFIVGFLAITRTLTDQSPFALGIAVFWLLIGYGLMKHSRNIQEFYSWVYSQLYTDNQTPQS